MTTNLYLTNEYNTLQAIFVYVTAVYLIEKSHTKKQK